MFVIPQDFIDFPYNLPKMTDADTIAAFNKFVTRNEAIELRKVLGSDFYIALIAGVTALPAVYVAATNYGIDAKVLYGTGDIYKSKVINNVGVTPGTDGAKWELQAADKWAKLVYGESYTDINEAKENWVGMVELVKPMIYGLWLRDALDTSVQGSGVVQQTSENAKNVDSGIRFSEALEAYSFLIGGVDSNEVDTLYNYLYTKSENFNDIGVAIPVVGGDFKNYLKYYFTNPGFVNDFGF